MSDPRPGEGVVRPGAPSSEGKSNEVVPPSQGRLRRAGWSLADQALSSLTNVALTVVAARLLPVEAFGAFAVALATYLVVVGLTRATSGELVVAQHSAGGADAQARPVLGAAAIMGLLGGMAAVIVGALLGGPVGSALVVLSCTLPALALQDTLRYLFVAQGRPSLAFANDAVWAAAQLLLVGLVVTSKAQGVGLLIAAWGGAGACAALFGLLQARVLPSLAAGRRWYADNRSLWPRFASEFAATMGAWQLTLFLVGAVGGLAALAALRAAQVLYGPLHVVQYGARLAVVPEGVRDLRRGQGGLVPRSLGVGLGVGAISMVWALVVVIIPGGVGAALLGDSWASADTILLPFGLFMVAQGMQVGATIGLRILVAAQASLRASLLGGLALVAIPTVCALVGDVVTVAWGLVVAGALSAGVWWVLLVQASGTTVRPPVTLGDGQ